MNKNLFNLETTDFTYVPTTVKEMVLFAIKPHYRKLSLFFVLTLLGVLSWNGSTYIASELISNLSDHKAVTSSAWVLVAFFAVFRMLDESFWRLGEILMRTLKPQMIERVRMSLFSATLRKNHSYYVNNSSGRVAHWINKATDSMDSVLNNTIWSVWGEVLGMVFATIFLFTTHWSLALLFAGWLITLFWYNARRGRKFSRLVAVKSDESSKASSIIVDSLANNINVRVANARAHEERVLHDKQVDVIRAWRKEWKYAIITNTIKGQSAAAVNAVAVVLVLVLFSRGTVDIGGLALFLAYFNAASTGLWHLAWSFDEYYRQFGTMQNALDGLQGERERVLQNLAESSITPTSLTIENLTFVYDEAKHKKVLDSLTVSVQAGEKLGVVGHSGAGKSTLVGLLLGLYEPTSGRILVNGDDIASHDPSFVRELSAYVPQDTSMFNRSIRENIVYARPKATDEEITDALTKANAYDFVMSLPHGLDTLVGERGVKLSGGQRQRIAITRAILKDAPLLILDEATSALDSVSEQAIQKALHELMKGRTAIVVAHRLSTLKHLDKIIVVEKGRIVEEGSHEELLKIKDGVYADLWRRQKDGFIVD